MNPEKNRDLFEIIIQILLIVMITLPPLALGAVATWARGTLFLLALLLFTLWLIHSARKGRIRLLRTPVWLFILLFFGLAFFQRVPLSPSTLKILSPGHVETYTAVLPDYAESGRHLPLSVYPQGTGGELMRMAIPAIIFFVVVHGTRRRGQVTALVLALVAVGAFEALYGFAEHFSGHKHIFWTARRYHMASVVGTFHNKNHFAGMLEMIVPLCLGFLFALSPPGKRERHPGAARGTPRSGLAEVLSSPRIHLQAALAVVAVIMVVAILFSLSRAGILCVAAGLLGFFLFLIPRAGFRKYTVILLLIVAAVLLVAYGISMELVVTRLEAVASVDSVSWLDRVNLARSGLLYFRDYPVFGSGLGTFAALFPHYQSARFGDRVADYLHNDWLQLFCETGLLGGLVLLAGLGYFIVIVCRSVSLRREGFCKWVAAGALLGAGSMLLHSFFDYNLSRTTSNSIIFAVLLGLACACANMEGRGKGASVRVEYRTISLKALPASVAAVVVAVGLLAASCFPLSRLVLADIHINRYLETSKGHSPRYFFLPARAEDDPGAEHLKKAAACNPGDPRLLYYTARQALYKAHEPVWHRAVAAARARVDRSLETEDPRSFQQVALELYPVLKKQMLRERMPFLLEAKAGLKRAMDATPTAVRNHIALAYAQAEMDPLSQEVVKTAEAAFWLAPNKPSVLLAGGRILLSRLNADRLPDEEREETFVVVRKLFRKILYTDPSYAGQVYPLARRVFGGREALFAVTPPTMRAYEVLCRTLWESEDWEGVLSSIEPMEALANSRTGAGWEGWEPPRLSMDADWEKVEGEVEERGASGYDPRDPVEIRLYAEKRRCAALGALGRWEERKGRVARYRDLLRQRSGKEIDEAARLHEKGRNVESLKIVQALLREDSGNTVALLCAARIAALPRVPELLSGDDSALDYLYRIIIGAESDLPLSVPALSDEDYEAIMSILGSLTRLSPSERLTAAFIRGAAAVLARRPEEGIKELLVLANLKDEPARSWRQRHLFWFYLGLGYEKMEDAERAKGAYSRAVELLPDHRDTWIRLAALYPKSTPQLERFVPENPCGVNFGGKIVLLGFTLGRELFSVKQRGIETEVEDWCMTYYWEFRDGMHRGYRPAVHFCDENWRILFQMGHPIRSNKKVYPVDFPRCGEVVVEKQRLTQDLTKARYLRVAIYSSSPPKSLSNFLLHDGGFRFFFTAIDGTMSGSEPKL